MKRDSHFKLSKETKRILSTIDGPNRGLYKKSMIDAEINVKSNERVIFAKPVGDEKE